MRFQFDPAKAASNLKKHGVSFADVEGVFYDPLAIHQLDPVQTMKSGLLQLVWVAREQSWLLSTRFVAKKSELYRLVVLRGMR